MSQSTDHESARFPVNGKSSLQERSSSELQASLVPQQYKSIITVNTAIRNRGPVDELSGDVRSALLQVLDYTVAEPDDIDPTATTEAGAPFNTAQRTKPLSQAWS